MINWVARLIVGCISSCCICSLGGCGKADLRVVEIYPVDGQLFFEQRPAAGASITFHPEIASQSMVNCQVREDGHFVPIQPDGAIGLPAGSYVVTARWLHDGEDKLAGRYADRSKPLAKIEVEAAVNLLTPIRIK